MSSPNTAANSQKSGEHSSDKDDKSGPEDHRKSEKNMMMVVAVGHGRDTREQIGVSTRERASSVPSATFTSPSINGPATPAMTSIEQLPSTSSSGSNMATHSDRQRDRQHHHCSTITTGSRLPVSRQGQSNSILNLDTETRGSARCAQANASSPRASDNSRGASGTFENVPSTSHVASSETEHDAVRPQAYSAVTAQINSASRKTSTTSSASRESSSSNALSLIVVSNTGLPLVSSEGNEDQQGNHISSAANTIPSPGVTTSVSTTAAATDKASTTEVLVAIAPKEATVSTIQSHSAPTRPAVAASLNGHVSAEPSSTVQAEPTNFFTQQQDLQSATSEAATPTSVSTTTALVKGAESKAESASEKIDSVAMSISNTPATSAAAEQTPEAANELKSPPNKGKRKRSFSGSMKAGQTAGRWTHGEHQAFLEGLKECGREWKKVAMRIPTRTSAQIRSHAQKYFAKLQRDQDNHHHLLTTTSLSGLPTATHDDSPDVVVTGESGLLIGSTIATHPSNSVVPSVQRNVARIMADPQAAQQEVESTLEALRQRYRQLQQRLDERRQRRQHRRGDSGNDSFGSLGNGSPSPPAAMFVHNARLSQKRLLDIPRHHGISAMGADENASVSSTVSSVAASRVDLGSEEIIALQVLGGELPRGDSSVEDTASASAMAHIDFEEASATHSTIDNSNSMELEESSASQKPKTSNDTNKCNN